MAQPVTNLTALWVQNVGIQLSWTAASDVTTSSTYEIYALKNTPIVDFPVNYQYVEFSQVRPESSLITGSGTRVLQPPATTAIFPWSSVLQLGVGSSLPLAVTIQIVHADGEGNESNGLTVTAYPSKTINNTLAPHFPNTMKFDPNFGNVIVNEQDSNDEVTASVEMLLGSVIGQRSAVPGYGLDDMPLNQINVANIQKAISKWETRAKTTVSLQYDNYNNATLNVKIQNNGRS